MNRDPAELEQVIAYRFRDRDLFLQALTHSSYANEHRQEKAVCNERLEFLGDAVLELVCSDYRKRFVWASTSCSERARKPPAAAAVRALFRMRWRH